MIGFKLDYDDCKYLWDKKNKKQAYGFENKTQMIKHIADKFGVSKLKHPELKEYAQMYVSARGCI